MQMISETGLVMLGLFGMANVGFWAGYFAGKSRWKDAEPSPGAVGADELQEVQ